MKQKIKNTGADGDTRWWLRNEKKNRISKSNIVEKLFPFFSFPWKNIRTELYVHKFSMLASLITFFSFYKFFFCVYSCNENNKIIIIIFWIKLASKMIKVIMTMKNTKKKNIKWTEKTNKSNWIDRLDLKDRFSLVHTIH